MLIDTNLTYSPQVCDYAVGAIFGSAGILYLIGRLIVFGLIFYLIYRITEVFINKYNYNKFPINRKSCQKQESK